MATQKQVNNHIHNTLGITKKEIRDMVMKQAKQIAQKWAEKHVKECLNTWDIKKIFTQEVAELKQKGVDSGYLRSKSFEGYVKEVIEEVIKEAVAKQIKFKINVESK